MSLGHRTVRGLNMGLRVGSSSFPEVLIVCCLSLLVVLLQTGGKGGTTVV